MTCACIKLASHAHNSHVAGTAPLGPDSGMPVAMEGEEQSPEEAEQALAKAITDRIAAIDAQLGKLGMLQVH